MAFKRILIGFCIGLLALQAIGCGDKAAKKVESEAPRDGRDREIYVDGLKAIQKRRYEEGRILLNTMISTYDNSPILPLAKLLIADSFYREGGSSNLAQAEVEYREWLQFFPNHQLADDVLLKIADIHIRQVDAPNRDWTEARAAERELVRIQKEYPQTDLNPEVKDKLKFVREQLGMHELGITRFYFKYRQGWNAVVSRGRDMLKKYPEFSYVDEVLFLVGSALVEKEDTPEAAKYFSRLVREFPNSEYRDKAAEFLERFGMEVPDPSPTAETKETLVERKGFVSRMKTEIFGPNYDVNKEGVVLTKNEQLKPEIEAMFNLPKTDLTTPDATLTTAGGKVKTFNKDDEKQKQDGTQKSSENPAIKQSNEKKSRGVQ